jgi:hypothetical protein
MFAGHLHVIAVRRIASKHSRKLNSKKSRGFLTSGSSSGAFATLIDHGGVYQIANPFGACIQVSRNLLQRTRCGGTRCFLTLFVVSCILRHCRSF